MTSGRVEATKVGIFLVAAGLLLAGLLVAVVGSRWLRRDRIYHAVFSGSVGGLDEGSAVRYLGVPAGTVQSLAFETSAFPSIRVTLRIREGIPIQTGTRATLRTNPLTGLATIQLEGGEAEGPELSPGETIPEAPTLIDRIGSSLPDILVKIPETLEEIGRAARAVEQTLDAPTRERVRGTLDALAAAAREIERSAASVREDLRATRERVLLLADRVEREAAGWGASIANASESISDAAGDISGVAGTVKEAAGGVATAAGAVGRFASADDFARTAAALRAFAEDLGRLAVRVEETVERLRGAVDAASPAIGETLRGAREAVRHLKDLVDRLRDDPSALLFSPTRRERDIPDGERR